MGGAALCKRIYVGAFIFLLSLCEARLICLGVLQLGALQLVKVVPSFNLSTKLTSRAPPHPLALHSVHFCTISQTIQQKDDRMQYTAG